VSKNSGVLRLTLTIITTHLLWHCCVLPRRTVSTNQAVKIMC